MTRTPSLWESDRMSLERSIALTIESLHAYGPLSRHWAVDSSDGRDSTATVTLFVHLLASGQIAPPETFTALDADTCMELPPLHVCALTILGELAQRPLRTQVLLPDLDDCFFASLFGRGVPAPKNRFRWCTAQLNIELMERALVDLRQATGEKLLMLTGVRLGQSAARDSRIASSCDRDGTECGQGWFQEATPDHVADVLAPLLHWRVCHIWDWLTFHAPTQGYATQQVAKSSGGEEAEEINARTGCTGCNQASKDVALDALLKLPQWSYLAPLKRLKPLDAELKRPVYRLRKQGERNKDGRLSAHSMRLGPYALEARRAGLAAVFAILDDIKQIARAQERPLIDLINDEEPARILELIAADTWPDRWTGREVHAPDAYRGRHTTTAGRWVMTPQIDLNAAAALLVEIAGPEPVHIEMWACGPKKYYKAKRWLIERDARAHLAGRSTRAASIGHTQEPAARTAQDSRGSLTCLQAHQRRRLV